MKTTSCFLTVLLLGLGACSPPPHGPAGARIVADGITPRLSRSAVSSLYNLEQINAVVEPLIHQPVSVPRDEDLTVAGWAVDKSSQSEASGIEIVIDGKAYRARSGVERPDVSQVFGVPAYSKSGFSFSAPADDLGKGRHELTLRIVLADQKSYVESPVVIVNVE